MIGVALFHVTAQAGALGSNDLRLGCVDALTGLCSCLAVCFRCSCCFVLHLCSHCTFQASREQGPAFRFLLLYHTSEVSYLGTALLINVFQCVLNWLLRSLSTFVCSLDFVAEVQFDLSAG